MVAPGRMGSSLIRCLSQGRQLAADFIRPVEALSGISSLNSPHVPQPYVSESTAASCSGNWASWPSAQSPSPSAHHVSPSFPSLPRLQHFAAGSALYQQIRAFRTAAASNSKTKQASAAPASAAYSIEVVVTAFEERYLDAASNVIQDLFLINFAPKAMSKGPRWPGPCKVALAGRQKNIKVDWKKSRFTLIRGPHIDKTGMEQFETRRYKKAVSGTTNTAGEVHWLLEHLKLYEFTGVQVEVNVTGSTYLTPSASSSVIKGGDRGSVLAQHQSDIAQYIKPAAAVAAVERARSADGGKFDEELRDLLQTMRGTLRTGLVERRETLKVTDWYQAWHNMNKPGSAAKPMDAPPASLAGLAAGGAVAGISDEQRRQTSALLAAIDTSLLSLRFDALERHAGFPFHFATFVPGTGKIPAVQWMHAVLKYGQYKHRLEQLTQEAQLLKAYSSYNLFSHTLLYTLFRIWAQQTVSELKPYLALPTAAEAEHFMTSMASGAGKKLPKPGEKTGGRGPLFARDK